MAVKLHRCATMWIKGPHPCWKVQKALRDAGVEYELVKHGGFPRSKRTAYIELTGQKLLPAIQLEDGTVVRRDSKQLVELIKSGKLADAGAAGGSGAQPSAQPPAG